MADQWYYARAGEQLGPATIQQLRDDVSRGRLLPSDLVWREGLETWAPAGNFAELFPPGVSANPYSSPAGLTAAFPGHHDSSSEPANAPALWNPRAAAGWSLLFSWAFGGFLLARNWKALGQAGRARRSMIWFYAFFGFLLAILLLPDSVGLDKIGRAIGFGIFLVWVGLEVNPQVRFIEQHFSGRYPRKPWGKPIGIGIACCAVALVGIFGYAFASLDYGSELTFKKGQLFFKPPVTKEEATALGNYLVQEGVFDDREKTIQLLKSGGTYQFRMVVNAGSERDPVVLDAMKEFGGTLSRNVFHDARVDIHLCDEQLETRHVVPFK